MCVQMRIFAFLDLPALCVGDYGEPAHSCTIHRCICALPYARYAFGIRDRRNQLQHPLLFARDDVQACQGFLGAVKVRPSESPVTKTTARWPFLFPGFHTPQL